MNAKSLEVGVTYFRIAYADVDQTMPSVEPMVYVGMDIFGLPKDGVSRYYFQETSSIIRFGLGRLTEKSRVANSSDADHRLDDCVERIFFGHEEHEIGQVVVDLRALGEEIQMAIQRAQNLGIPRLQQAKGRWR